MADEKQLGQRMTAYVRGRRIVHSDERYRDGTDRLEEVLADLMFYAERDGRDFEEALRLAMAIRAEEAY